MKDFVCEEKVTYIRDGMSKLQEKCVLFCVVFMKVPQGGTSQNRCILLDCIPSDVCECEMSHVQVTSSPSFISSTSVPTNHNIKIETSHNYYISCHFQALQYSETHKHI